MIFDELSIAFFRFFLRCLGAELVGGGLFKHPPPTPGRGKSRLTLGRGLRCGSLIYFISGQSKKVKTEQEFKKIKIKANAKLEQDMFDDDRRKTKVSKTLEE